MTRQHTDLSRVPISVAPSPATSGTSLGVTDANAAYLPDTYPYWAVLVPVNVAPTRANSEIVKVTGGSSSGGTTTLTIVRAQGTPVTTAKTVTTSFDIYDANSTEALGTVLSVVVNEVPGGSVNSSNTSFTSAASMITGSLKVYQNGIRLKGGGVDFTQGTGTAFTMVTAPTTGDLLLIDYQTSAGTYSTGSTSFVYDETPSGTVNSSNVTFTIASTPVAGSLVVYRDGQRLIAGGADYTLSGTTITFVTAPTTGSTLKADYQSAVSAAGNADTVDGIHASVTPTAAYIPVLDSSMAMIGNGMYRQVLINGNMDIWQRGATITCTAADSYAADRWYVQTATATTDKTVSRQTVTGVTGSYYSARVAIVQDVDELVTFSQALETQDSLKFVGNKLTLSFYAKAGAEFVADNSTLVSKIVTGKGTDQKVLSFTTSADAVSQNNTLTTSWQRFTCTTSAVIASDITQIGVSFGFTHAGSGVTTNYFEVTQVQLCAGDMALPFQPKSFNQELGDCLRYYEKSYAYGTDPATATTSAGMMLGKVASNTVATAERYGSYQYRVRKRSVSAPTIYPFNTPTNTSRVSASEGGGDLAANSGVPVYYNDSSFIVYNNSGGTLTTDRLGVIFHFTADAEL